MADVPHNGEKELGAMRAAFDALKPLDAEGRSRAIDWLVRVFGLRASPHKKGGGSGSTTAEPADTPEADDEIPEFTSFAELCSAASPDTDAQKAMVAGYWFQICEGEESFGSRECNDQLKHFGVPVGNITRAFDTLKDSTPNLAMQIEKSGKTKQARKKYKLTHHGIQAVKRMLNE